MGAEIEVEGISVYLFAKVRDAVDALVNVESAVDGVEYFAGADSVARRKYRLAIAPTICVAS
jgi:hypothetical protein